MAGPLRTSEGDNKYLLVMVDKFTKWIEVNPVSSQAVEPVIKFISGVIHRHDMPHIIITDKRKKVQNYYEEHKIKLDRLRLRVSLADQYFSVIALI